MFPSNPASDPAPARAAPTERVVWQIVYSDEHFKAHARHLRQSDRWGWRLVVNLSALIIIVALNVAVFTSTHQSFVSRVVLPCLLAVQVLSQLNRPWWALRRWRKLPLWNRSARYELTPAGMYTVDEVSEGKARWAVFTRARRFQDGLLLFFGPRLACWLPDACLVSGSVTDAVRLARHNVLDYKEA